MYPPPERQKGSTKMFRLNTTLPWGILVPTFQESPVSTLGLSLYLSFSLGSLRRKPHDESGPLPGVRVGGPVRCGEGLRRRQTQGRGITGEGTGPRRVSVRRIYPIRPTGL